MKKIILGCAILCGCLTFAQTATPTTSRPTTLPEATQSQATAVKTEIDELEGVAKNIDRRLVYFNRYKQMGDIASLEKLVSDENKDFYTNFIKYVESSSVFTLKRDTEGKIVKTPTGEYTFPAIMRQDEKDIKVSITFIEVTSEQGKKWLIYTSNLHIQSPLSSGDKKLTSSALDQNKKTTRPATQQTKVNPTNTEEKAVATMPVVKKTEPIPQNTTPIKDTATIKGLSNTNLIFISLAIILVIVSSVVYYLVAKKKKAKISAISAAAAATLTAAPSSSLDGSQTSSNVTISSVKEVQNETSNIEEAPEVSSSNRNQTSSENIEQNVLQTPPTISEENTALFITEATTPLPSTLVLDEEKEIILTPETRLPIEPVISEKLPIEMPVSDLFTTAAQKETTTIPETDTKKLIEMHNDTDTTPHALFEGVFESVSPEQKTQNPLNTAS